MSASRSVLAHHFDTLEQQRDAQTIGMWAFLATEILVFGALFTGYIVYRYQFPYAFEKASEKLSLTIGGWNTVVLLTSSLTMALAVFATQAGRRRMQISCLIATFALGALFLGFKAVEYTIDYRENLVPGYAFDPKEWAADGADPRHVQLFYVFYYIMTGLHAVHMIGGLAVLAVVIVRTHLGHFTPENFMGVELMGLYWHFVDVIWIFLLPLLYLVGTRPIG